ncbi:hypothetical protein ACIQ4I_15380 [Rummeliibacillus sp. NPDC094406]|uniref:hypothetical protein n=1 Tax=Rummeliibacillus sp. NPDC094406 TaxID=3364511 RepID=UPI0037FFFF17
MQIKNLFKTKRQAIIESCHDIKSIVDDSIKTIDNMQDCVVDMQKNIQELIKLNEENIQILDEVKIKLDKKLGDE